MGLRCEPPSTDKYFVLLHRVPLVMTPFTTKSTSTHYCEAKHVARFQNDCFCQLACESSCNSIVNASFCGYLFAAFARGGVKSAGKPSSSVLIVQQLLQVLPFLLSFLGTSSNSEFGCMLFGDLHIIDVIIIVHHQCDLKALRVECHTLLDVESTDVRFFSGLPDHNSQGLSVWSEIVVH